MFTHYFKVGLGIILAGVIIVVGYSRLSEKKYSEKNSYRIQVVFDNVQGISAGNEVWISGIKVGTIERQSLRQDGKAVLTLAIQNEFKIPKGSLFNIQVGFLGDRTLSIENPAKPTYPTTYYSPNEVVENAKSPSTLPDLMNEAHISLIKINAILDNVNSLIGDANVKRNMLEITNNIALATNEAYAFTKMLSETGAESKGDIRATMSNIKTLTDNLNKTADKVDALLTSADGLVKNANSLITDDQMKTDLKAILTSLKATSLNVEATTASIKDVTTDKEVITDLKQTIKTTRNTMDSADVAIKSFSKMIHAINDTEFRPTFDFTYNTTQGKYSADMNIRVFPPNSEVYYLMGIDDLGENGDTNLQFGVKGALPRMWYRFGLKENKLGVGFEYKHNNMYYDGNLLDPNELKLNLRAGKALSPNLYVTGGVKGIFDSHSLTIGVLQMY